MVLQAQLLDIVGQIYDSVLDSTVWPLALQSVVDRFDFHNGILGVNDVSGGVFLNVTVNVSPEQQRLVEQHGEDILALWGGVARMQAFPLEEPLLQSWASDPEGWVDNAYYQRFAAPQGVVDTLGIGLLRDRRTFATLGMGRHRDAKALTADDFDELRLLAPHLVRAVTVSRLMEGAFATAATFRAALDASPHAVVLVDDAGRPVHANRAGQSMLSSGDPLRERHGRVELSNELAPGRFAAALEAAPGEVSLGRQGLRVPTRRTDGTPLALSIMPLERRTLRDVTVGNAAAAIFVASPDSQPAPASDMLEQLFDLTPAEARVFMLVASGHGTRAIAQQIGIAPSTIKTHLLRIFRKTDCHNRAGLVAVAHGLGVGNPATSRQ